MRPSQLKNILSVNKYRKLSRNFKTPFKALLASSGAFSRPWCLVAADGSRLECNRGDCPLWEEYFLEKDSCITIENGLFHITPHNKEHPDYYIKGTHDLNTHSPSRWTTSEATPGIVTELEKAERSYFSQHGEDGVLIEIIRRIKPRHSYIVEFGAYDGECMSNSRYWITEQNWSALLIEPGRKLYRRLSSLYRNTPRVTTINSLVTEDNINTLFRDANVPEDFDILSIDIDSYDYYVWAGLKDFKPRVVVIEFNSSIPPDRDYVVDRDKVMEYAGTEKEGASISSFIKLGKSKGYHLVYEELSGANLFFIHDTCMHCFDNMDITAADLYQPPQFGALAGSKAPNGRGYTQ